MSLLSDEKQCRNPVEKKSNCAFEIREAYTLFQTETEEFRTLKPGEQLTPGERLVFDDHHGLRVVAKPLRIGPITGDTITVAKIRDILGILTDAQMKVSAIHTLSADSFISTDAAAHRLNAALENLIAKLS